MKDKSEAYGLGYYYDSETNITVLTVTKKSKNGLPEIVNIIYGETADDVYKKLILERTF